MSLDRHPNISFNNIKNVILKDSEHAILKGDL